MSISITKLDNGLSVVTEDMPHLESAAMGVWVKAGARDETLKQHGVAHLLEHMAFKGTPTRSARDIAEQIENVGGDINAATSVETTSFYARIMGEDVPLALDMLHDILANSTFSEQEMLREKHVILQEIGAANDSPDDLVFDVFQNTCFGGQPIGRPILGTAETVTGFSADDIRQYLDAHYRGPNMVVSAAGKVDHAAFVKQAEKLFGSFSPELAEKPVQASFIGGEAIMERDIQEAHVLLGFEGRAYHVQDFYASQLLSVVLGGGMSSRLFQEIREKRGLCYSIYSFHWGFSDTGVFGIHAATGKEDLEELMPVLIEELLRASQDISTEEVDRARAQIRASLMMGMESPVTRAGNVARQILLFGRLIPVEEIMERLQALTPGRLMDLADRMFAQSDPTLTALGPVGDIMRNGEIRQRLQGNYSQAAE